MSEERKNWAKFGAAKHETPQDSVTAQGVEDIPFERGRQSKATSQEKKVDLQNILSNTNDKAMISGRCVVRMPHVRMHDRSDIG